MKRLILSTVAAAALAGSAFTYTAIAAAPDAASGPGAHRMAEQSFLLDAKLAGMKAALKLTADQEKSWPAFEAAVRDAAQERMQAMQARRQEMENGQRPSPIAMMSQMSDNLAKMSAELKKVSDAATPLYDSLDDGQKAHFGPLLRMLREGEMRQGGHGEHGPAGPKPL